MVFSPSVHRPARRCIRRLSRPHSFSPQCGRHHLCAVSSAEIALPALSTLTSLDPPPTSHACVCVRSQAGATAGKPVDGQRATGPSGLDLPPLPQLINGGPLHFRVIQPSAVRPAQLTSTPTTPEPQMSTLASGSTSRLNARVLPSASTFHYPFPLFTTHRPPKTFLPSDHG
jgi:hypothetical protein